MMSFSDLPNDPKESSPHSTSSSLMEAPLLTLPDEEEEDVEASGAIGCSLLGATFNFTNAIIGAGALGLGGSFADSGGFISIVCCIASATLSKISSDQVVLLRIHLQQSSYETIGEACFGVLGTTLVLINKSLFAFGCLVAYIIVIKDNFGKGLDGILYYHNNDDTSYFRTRVLQNDLLVTLSTCTFIILPICLFIRQKHDISSYLSALSLTSIISTIFMVAIVIYLYYFGNISAVSTNDDSFFKHWLQIHTNGLFQSLGTFVFCFIPHHTIDVTFDSLQSKYQKDVHGWKIVSSASLFLSLTISLTLAIFVYKTFWEHTKSDMFSLYPSTSIAVNTAKLFLCCNMLLTFVLPFLACKDMIFTLLSNLKKCRRRRHCRHYRKRITKQSAGKQQEQLQAQQQQLHACNDENYHNGKDDEHVSESVPTYGVLNDMFLNNNKNDDDNPELHESLLGNTYCDYEDCLEVNADDDKQQLLSSLPCHIFITFILWSITVVVALTAPNLGIVLDIVGAISGSMIGFILPGIFSMRLLGCTCMGVLMTTVGLIVGGVGTYFSVKKLVA